MCSDSNKLNFPWKFPYIKIASVYLSGVAIEGPVLNELCGK